MAENINQRNDDKVKYLFTQEEFLNSEVILNYFLKPFLYEFTTIMKNDIDAKLSFELSFRYYIIIAFLIVLIFGYLLVWLPFQYSLNDEILRTKNILEIIPEILYEGVEAMINS